MTTTNRNKKKNYTSTIYYTMDSEHPDIKYLNEDWSEDKIFSYSDIYRFPVDYPEDYCIEVIKEDLLLVAGGGHNFKHIHNVKFSILRD